MPSINAGKYRHQISIYEPPDDDDRDAFGERVGAGTLVASGLWAEKTDWNGSEVDELGRETPIVITRWRTRYREDIRARMYLVHGSHTYEITAPPLDFDGTHREITIESRRIES